VTYLAWACVSRLPDEQPGREQNGREQVDEHILPHGGYQGRDILRIRQYISDHLSGYDRRQQAEQAEGRQETEQHAQHDDKIGREQEGNVDVAAGGTPQQNRVVAAMRLLDLFIQEY